MVTLGNTKISKLYLGSTPVDKAYLGSQQVYPNASLALSASALSFIAAGETLQLTLTVEEGQPWEIIVPSPWSASAASGTGTATLTLTIDNNATTNIRSGVLTVNSEDLTATCELSQAAGAKTETLELANYTKSFSAAGGSTTIYGTYRELWNGVVTVTTSGVSPTLSGSQTGFTIAGNTVTAANRGTTAGAARILAGNATYNGASAAYSITQAENKETYSALTFDMLAVSNPISSSDPATKANGGTVTLGATASYTYSTGQTKSVDVKDSAAYNITSASAGGASISGRVLTWANRAAIEGGARSVTVRASYNGASQERTFYQQANSITAYGTPTGRTLAVSDIPASGGTVSSGTLGGTITQSRTYTSGTTDSVSNPTVSAASYSAAISANNLGTTIKSRTSIGTLTYYYTCNGIQGSVLATVYQAANAATSITYGTPSVTLKVSDIPASGGSVSSGTVTYSQSRTQNYTSGSRAPLSALTSGGSVSYSAAVSAGSLGTTVKARTAVGTLTATVTMNGKSGSGSASVYQAANTFNDNSMKLHFGSFTGANSITVGAGSSSTTVYLEVTRLYTSGVYQSGHNVTTGGTFTVSGTGFSISGSNVIAASRGTTVGAARSGTVTGKYNALTATGTIAQQENKVTNSNYNPRITAYGTPSVNIGSGITAAGGSATVSYSVSNTQTYNALYSSGATGPDQTRSVAGTTTISITANGNNRFSLSGNTLSHSSMGKNVTTDTVTITAKNSGDTSKTKTVTQSISNAVGAWVDTGITAYGTPSVSIGSGLTAAGGSATVSHSVSNTMGQKRTYTSGDSDTQSVSRAGTTTITLTGNGNSRFRLSGNTISHSNMGTNLTTDTVTVTATNSGQTSKTASASKSVTNGRTVTGTTGGVTTYGNVTAGTISNKTIPASGGSATATAGSGSQTWSKTATVTSYKYDSGDTSSATTENASSGTNTISPSVGSITASAASKGTTVSGTTTVKSQAVTWSGNGGKSTSGTMYVYQAANAVVSYAEISYNQFSYNRTIPYGGGTASPAGDITYKKSYSSGAKGPEEHGLPPGHSQYYVWTNSKPSWGDINSSTGVVTASANGNYSTRSASITVQITYNGSAIGVEATTTVTQAAYVKPTISLTFSYNQTGGTFVIYASQAVKDQLSIDYTYNDGGGMGGDGSITMGVNQTQVSGYAGGPDYPIAGITMVNFDSSGRLDTGNAIYTWTPV